jgi:hypothetical protein
MGDVFLWEHPCDLLATVEWDSVQAMVVVVPPAILS